MLHIGSIIRVYFTTYDSELLELERVMGIEPEPQVEEIEVRQLGRANQTQKGWCKVGVGSC